MKKHLMIAVNWYGPYGSLEEASEVAKEYWDGGLYAALGRSAQQKKHKIQYIGIAKELHGRLRTSPKIKEIDDLSLWLGQIATAEPSGRRMAITKPTLDFAEWLHVRFVRPSLNEKKTRGLPNRSVTILNRWWSRNDEPYAIQPHRDWPNLIDFPDDVIPARAVWFGGKQRLFQAPDYAN